MPQRRCYKENGYLREFVRILSKVEVDLWEKVPPREEAVAKREIIQAVTNDARKGGYGRYGDHGGVEGIDRSAAG
jgi:hypothetical protein